ncbi:MAG TPA: 3-hydroxyacyl-CoA dehydrogenase family protein [Candidatus Krumholzibacteria bacterium]|nr:3-hydroxyacyl-CoA dehydrogenase family protein [Candidatus Krumholzibacteria bacterium]
MKKVGVVGCGLMGSGIAQMSALNGYTTTVVEVNDDILKKGMASIESFLEKGKARGKVTDEQIATVKKNLSTSTQLSALKDCDIVVEAVTENTDLKKKVFKQLSDIVRDDAILATNTSSISVTELATVVKNPERMVGMHFFNPVPIMKLVEIIRGLATTDAVVAASREYALSLGKEPITCPDTPAFVVNKLLIPYLLDAVRMVQDGIATPEDVDKAMVHGCGYPMGPITLLDYVGLDTTCHAADVMYEEFREPKYAAPVLLRRMVQAGRWGRKTGRGFYDYAKK